MTYCMPVAITPKRLWALSLYHGTMTKDSFFYLFDQQQGTTTPTTTTVDVPNVKNDNNDTELRRGYGILQLLTQSHASLVPILGKKSGRDVNKEMLCKEVGYDWVQTTTTTTTIPKSSSSSTTTTNNVMTMTTMVLPQCALYVHVRLVNHIDVGDHVLAICEVLQTGIWDDGCGTKKKNNNNSNNNEIANDTGSVVWLVDDDDDATTTNGATSLFTKDGLDENNNGVLYTGWLRRHGIL